MSFILTPAEIAEITGYKRRTDQIRWLTAKGWTFEVNGAGRAVVSRAYAESKLGAPPERAQPRFDHIRVRAA